MKIEIDGFKFNFKNAIELFIFDEKDKNKTKYHGLSHVMKAVDLIVELENYYLFIEIKNLKKSPLNFSENDPFNNLCKSLKGKFRDTWLYRWAEKKIDKPIKYICLLTLENSLIQRIDKEMKIQLPVGKKNPRWKQEMVHSCIVLNLENWKKSKYFKEWSVSEIDKK